MNLFSHPIFIHRSGSSLNGPAHFHVCLIDGAFEQVASEVQSSYGARIVCANQDQRLCRWPCPCYRLHPRLASQRG